MQPFLQYRDPAKNRHDNSYEPPTSSVLEIHILGLYQSIHLHEREPPTRLFLPVLDGVDVEVDGAVEGCQQVAEAGHIRQPRWPGYFSLKCRKRYIFF